MYKTILSLALLFGSYLTAYAQQYPIAKDVKRVVFLGNSITYSGQFVSYIDAYFTLKYPNRQLEIINLGLPSETVSGLSEEGHADGKFPRPDLKERLQRVLVELDPDLVIVNYGMNDGIYLPFDESRFQAFQNGINWMHQAIEKSEADIIHVTPPVFDERKDPAYANVLAIYSSWLVSRRYTDDWKVIDSPFGNDDPIVLLPAIRPDVALFHAPMAERFGNVWIGRQRELTTMAHAAAMTIVTVEKIVDDNLLADPLTAAGTLPGFYVEHIAVAEHGAWPLPLPDHYKADTEHLALYAKLAATPEGFAEYLDRYVHETQAA